MKIKSWGEWVNKERRDAGFTKRDLGLRIGIDPSYITVIERDGYVPTRDVVIAIAEALGKDMVQILKIAGYSYVKQDDFSLIKVRRKHNV